MIDKIRYLHLLLQESQYPALLYKDDVYWYNPYKLDISEGGMADFRRDMGGWGEMCIPLDTMSLDQVRKEITAVPLERRVDLT